MKFVCLLLSVFILGLVEAKSHWNPHCLAAKDEGECDDKFLAWYYNNEKNTCLPFRYTGCGGTRNRFKSELECQNQCVIIPQCPRIECPLLCTKTPGDDGCPVCSCSEDEKEAICSLDRMIGTCRAHVKRWHFDRLSGQCKQFGYGGCRGNDNNFITYEKCQNFCINMVKDDSEEQEDVPLTGTQLDQEGTRPGESGVRPNECDTKSGEVSELDKEWGRPKRKGTGPTENGTRKDRKAIIFPDEVFPENNEQMKIYFPVNHEQRQIIYFPNN